MGYDNNNAGMHLIWQRHKWHGYDEGYLDPADEYYYPTPKERAATEKTEKVEKNVTTHVEKQEPAKKKDRETLASVDRKEENNKMMLNCSTKKKDNQKEPYKKRVTGKEELIDQLNTVAEIFGYLCDKKHETVINTLLKMSRLPTKVPKTFDGYDFDRLRGEDITALKSLPSLSDVNAGRNIAFVGPADVGKTHLAQAHGIFFESLRT